MANEVEIIVSMKDKTGGGLSSIDRKADGLRGTLRRVGETAAGFLSANLFQSAGRAAVGFFNDSTRAASDLNESISKSKQVFGPAATEVERFASRADRSLGLSKNAALDALGGFGNMFNQLGVGADKSAQMSESMTKLASDFASFHNLDITDVLDAQAAAFRGEYDAAQRFLPTLTAATVQTEAMRETGKTNATQLTAQEKALATYNLMLKGAGKAQGDFARTSKGAANQERIAKAEMENMQATIGQKLLPVSMKITQIKLALAKAIAERLVPALEKVGEWVQAKVVPAFRQFTEWAQARLLPILENLGAWISRNLLPPLAKLGSFLVGTVVPALAKFVDWLTRNQDVLAAVAIAVMTMLVPALISWAVSAGAAAVATLLAAAPFILLGAIIAAFALLVIKNWDTIKRVTSIVFNAVKDAIATAFNWVREHWPLLLAIITGPIGAAVYIVVRHWNTIKAGATAVWVWVRNRFTDLVNFFRGIPGKIAAIGRGMWNGITSGLVTAVNWALSKIEGMINGIIRAYNRIPIAPNIAPVSLPRLGTAGPGTRPVSYSRPIKQMAHGGIGGGLTLLGERAAELVDLPAGSRVHPPANTAQMLAGGGGRLVVELVVSGGDRELVALLQRWVQVKHGGDVQAALGWSR